MLEFEYARSALQERAASSSRSSAQSLQVRPDRQQRRAHRSRRHGGGQLLRQDRPAGAEPASDARGTSSTIRDRREDHGLGGRPSGYAAVWATENTREAHLGRHAAQGDVRHDRPAHGRALLRRLGLRRRRTRQTRCPATSATPKACRWAASCNAAPHGKAPTFLVAALRDPIGANLDRIQIVKGWLDADGKLHEKVYDVAWSGDRKPGADGKLPPVGNTVDVANATWTNTIGAPELIAVWTDPEFDPRQRAVLLRARASRSRRRAGRLTTRNASASRCRAEVPDDRQERAYTSPIWYTPG